MSERIYTSIVTAVLREAKTSDYSGYSKFDALNSPFLEKLSCNNKWLRFFFTQVVKECPYNIRPCFGVKKSRNPKGIALFARAYLYLFQQTNDEIYLQEAELLLEWLLVNPAVGSANLSWGYNFVWQSPLFLQDRYEPNTVVSVFVGEALIHAFTITGKNKYLDAARSVAMFITEELPVLYQAPGEKAIAYVLRNVKTIVLNNQVLVGSFLAKLYRFTEESGTLDFARQCVKFTVNRRTPYCCWYYTFPSGKSHIRHDNYHTGGILDGLLEYYEATKDERFQGVYWEGVKYYQARLFGPEGQPYWMNDRKYPYDVHGSAQGIITFAKASRYDRDYLDMAKLVADWAKNHLYDEDKRQFIYRIGRLITYNYSLMRWCNSWMTRALMELIMAAENGSKQNAGSRTNS